MVEPHQLLDDITQDETNNEAHCYISIHAFIHETHGLHYS